MPKISQLPTLLTITSGSIIPVVENSTTQKITVGKLYEFLSGTLDQTFTTEIELMRSASAITSSINTLSASFDQRIKDVIVGEASIPNGTISSSNQITALGYAKTGSNTFNGSQTISAGNSLLVNRIENTTGGNIEIAATGLLSLSGDGGGVTTNDNFEANPGGNATFKVISGSVIVTGSIRATGTTIISSSTQITALGFISQSITDTGSLLLTSSFNDFSSSVHQRILNATNEQIIDGFLLTSSFNDFSGSVHQRILDATNEQDLSTFATTGSNYFYGNQSLSGSIFFYDDYNNTQAAMGMFQAVSGSGYPLYDNASKDFVILSSTSDITLVTLLNNAPFDTLTDIAQVSLTRSGSLDVYANMMVSGSVTASYYLGDGRGLTNLPSTTNWNKDKEYILRNTEQLTFSGDYMLENSLLAIEGGDEEVEYSQNKYFKKEGTIFIGGNLLLKDSTIVNDGKISVGGEVILIGNSQIVGTGTII